MTGDRLILGAAIGYRPDEFALYDAEFDRRGAQLEELISILRPLWRGETVDHEGRFYKVHGRIEPVPAVAPPIWIGGWGPDDHPARRELADAWVPGPTAGMPKLLELRAAYDAALTDGRRRPCVRAPAHHPRGDHRADRCPGARPGREAPDGQLPRGVRRRHLEASAHRCRGPDPPRSARGDRPRPVHRRLTRDLPSRPSGTFQEQLGIDHLICRLFFPGMPHDHIMSEIKLLAEEVIPAFR